MERLGERAMLAAGQRAAVDQSTAIGLNFPPLFRERERRAGDSSDLPDEVAEDDRAEQDDREDEQLGFDHRADSRAGQLRLAEVQGLRPVVVKWKRCEP